MMQRDQLAARGVRFLSLLSALVCLCTAGMSMAAPRAAYGAALTANDLDSIARGTEWYKLEQVVRCKKGADGPTNLQGNDNAEKIYNYLVSHELSPIQAAGIMGNLYVESTYDPGIVEIGGGGGFGIAQWTGPRRTSLENAAKAQGVDVADLAFQLDYLYEESANRDSITFPGVKEWEGLKRMTDLTAAVLYWEKNFERSIDTNTNPATNPGLQKRINAGNDALTQFGSNSASTGAVTGIASCAGSNGDVTNGMTLPVAKSWYESNKVWFTKPHHDYPASDIPAPENTPVFSILPGKITKAPVGDDCGNGVTVTSPGNVIITYCHGSDGGRVAGAESGAEIGAGQTIMHLGYTGHVEPPGPAGAHLHVQMTVNGQARCPQALFVAIAEGTPVDLASLPTSGCSN